ncbi:MAG: sulfatase [Solirubrobacterales bacterium]|jgi:arylsulfatase A-like enzyme|nr:sulfatase [Solirubrobacterales bacterium]
MISRGFAAFVVAVFLGLAASGLLASGASAATKPSFVVIQTDDQPLNEFDRRFRDIYDNWRQVMPRTMALLRDKGITFSQYTTPFPLCAPSRATLLSGRYAQNHGVIRIGGPRGGWEAWQTNPIMYENLPVWLQRAGYETLHFGKFMNYYGGPDDPAETIVPPGWDRWVTDATDNSTREFYGYRQNIDGEITPRLGWPFYDTSGGRDPDGCPWLGVELCNYHTDSMSMQAEQAIRDAGPEPFFLQIDYHTPHGDSRPPIGPEPAPRHYDTALRTPGPRPPGFNERDISDKPRFLQEAATPMSGNEISQIDTEFRKSVEALRSVDDGVGRIISALRETGRLANTYVIFTSDNGFFTGQHRISRGKLLPYEPALRVPFVIRGPGIRAGTRSYEPVANQDVAPTIIRLADARAALTIDGRSLRPFWTDPGRRSRRPILLSSYQQITRLIPGDYPDEPAPATGEPATANRNGAHASVRSPEQNYVGIRLGPYKYVRYENGERELYVLREDPAELENRAADPRYRKILRYLDTQLDELRGCRGQSCRNWAPPWPQPPQ